MPRHTHDRQRDHEGVDLDTNIEIDGDIGSYLSGTDLHTVLLGMDAAINSGGGAGADEKVKVSSNDTTAGYLNGKLVAGTNIALTENNDGGDETLTISSTGGGGGGAGWAPAAFPVNFSASATFTTAQAIPASGGLFIVPIAVPSPMLVTALRVRRLDTTGTRSIEWRLYVQNEPNGGTTPWIMDEIAGLNGSESGTASVASTRTIDATTPATIDPGTYWAILRNTHASNTWGLGTAADNFGAGAKTAITAGGGYSALGSTFDMLDVVDWGYISSIAAVSLSGIVFDDQF